MPFLFMAYSMNCNSVKTVEDKVIASTTTMKEKQFSCVLISLGIYLFITTINTKSACLLIRLRVQIIIKPKENLRMSFQIASQKKILSLNVYITYYHGGNDYINTGNSIIGAQNYLRKNSSRIQVYLCFTTFLMVNYSTEYFGKCRYFVTSIFHFLNI